MDARPHPSRLASLANGSRNRVESRELVRSEPPHKQYNKLALGSRASDDVVGAVGGCFRAEYYELIFSHRHNLLTPNRGTPSYTSLMRAEASTLIIRVMRPPSIIVGSGTGIQVPKERDPFPPAPYLVYPSSRNPGFDFERLVCVT